MKKTPKPEKNVISICAFLAILAATFTGFSLVAGGVNEIKVVPSQNSEQKAQKFNTTDLKRTDIGADRRDGYALTKTCAKNSHLSVSSGLDTDRILFGASANPRDGANVFALDSKGNKIWNYLEPRKLTERTNNLVLTNDGGALLTGYIRLKKGWMSKKYDHMSRLKRLGNDGKIVWERSYDFQDDPRRKIVESSDGSFFLLKNYDSFPEIEGEGSKINLTRIDSRGDVVWDKTVLGHGFNQLTNMIALPDGGLLIAGYLFGGKSTKEQFYILRLTAHGEILWEKLYGSTPKYQKRAQAITLTAKGDFLITGFTSIQKGEKRLESYLLKLNSQGEKIWERIYSQRLGYVKIVAGQENGFFLIGNERELKKSGRKSENIKLVYFDEDGTEIWSKQLSDFAFCPTSISVGSNNAIYIAQTLPSWSLLPRNSNHFLLHLDADGQEIWKNIYTQISQDPLVLTSEND